MVSSWKAQSLMRWTQTKPLVGKCAEKEHHPIEELRSHHRHRDSPLTPDLGAGTGASYQSAYTRLMGKQPPGVLLGPRQPCPLNSLTASPSIHVLEAIMGIALPAASLGPAVPQVGIHLGLHQPCGFPTLAGPAWHFSAAIQLLLYK